MNKITCEFQSQCLKEITQVTILLPKDRPSPLLAETAVVFSPLRTLYLLHGAMESPETWLWNSGIAQLVDEWKLAVVMPNGRGSFYLDEPDGPAYFSFLTQELPEYLEQILPLSSRREDRFIGGLSMGGYGAVFAALMRPERFGKVFSMSGALDVAKAVGFVKVAFGNAPWFLRDRKALENGPYDLMHLLDGIHAQAIPPMLLTCGSGDYFLHSCRKFQQKAEAVGIRSTLSVTPGGHDWPYWNEQLPLCIRWLLDAADGML